MDAGSSIEQCQYEVGILHFNSFNKILFRGEGIIIYNSNSQQTHLKSKKGGVKVFGFIEDI